MPKTRFVSNERTREVENETFMLESTPLGLTFKQFAKICRKKGGLLRRRVLGLRYSGDGLAVI